METIKPTRSGKNGEDRRVLARLAHFTARRRWPVIAAWIVLTLIAGGGHDARRADELVLLDPQPELRVA